MQCTNNLAFILAASVLIVSAAVISVFASGPGHQSAPTASANFQINKKSTNECTITKEIVTYPDQSQLLYAKCDGYRVQCAVHRASSSTPESDPSSSLSTMKHQLQIMKYLKEKNYPYSWRPMGLFDDSGNPGIVMEAESGLEPISGILDKYPFWAKCKVLDMLMLVIGMLHKYGVVHRLLSADSILIEPDEMKPVLTDFRRAKQLQQLRPYEVAKDAKALGKLAFKSLTGSSWLASYDEATLASLLTDFAPNTVTTLKSLLNGKMPITKFKSERGLIMYNVGTN